MKKWQKTRKKVKFLKKQKMFKYLMLICSLGIYVVNPIQALL